jgi:hypothetical protein
VLPDKFIAGGIIAKLPPSWRNFATSLKHKRQEFSVIDLIGSLDVEEKARAKDTRPRGAEGGSSANVVQNKTSNLTSPRTRTNLMAKESLMGRTNHHSLPTSRRRQIRGKEHAMYVANLDTGHLVAQTALTSIMGKAARPQMLSLAMLR